MESSQSIIAAYQSAAREFRFWYAPRRTAARVVKLVDTGDLKSPAYCRRAGSIPASGTSKNKDLDAFARS